MSINIIKIKINSKELTDWLNNAGFVCLETEEYYSTTYAHKLFDEELQDEIDDHDYTFDDWCEDHEIYTKWDVNHQYGSGGWEWDVISDENCEIQWLIIAVKEY